MAEPKFSLLRALRTQIERLPRAPELKASADLAKRSNVAARGILVPTDALDPVQRRDLTTDSLHQGGALVSEGTIRGEPQRALRPVRWSTLAGVQEVSGLEGRGEVALPIHKGVSAAGWVDGQYGEVPKSDETMGQVALMPRHVGARTVISRNLLKQSSIDAENWVRRMLRETVEDAIDEAIIQGSGVDNEPWGITQGIPGVHAVALTTAGKPTRDEIIDTFAAAANANADPRMLRFVGDSTLAQTMRKAKVETGGTEANKAHSGVFLLEDGLLAKTAPFLETNHVPGNTLIVGDFSKVVVGRWADPYDIVVNPFGAHGPKGEVEVVVFASVDVAVAQPKAFAVAE